MKRARTRWQLLALALAAACGGGGDPGETYRVGGTVTGLEGSGLVLHFDGENDLAVPPGASSYTFDFRVVGGRRYAIIVAHQPTNPSQSCVIENGAGTITGDIEAPVVCTTTAFEVGGVVRGLRSAGLAVQLGDERLPVSGSGAFVFANPVRSGESYAVTVATQPAGETCVVERGTGVVGAEDVASVSVLCSGCPGGWCPQPAIQARTLADVWGSGPDDVWAVGELGTILRWNGSSWASVASGTGFHLSGLWGSGPNDVWAVGSNGLALHWNGSAGSPDPSSPPSGHWAYLLMAVWGSSASDVWASGGILQHWDGTAWSAASIGGFSDMWGVGPNDIWGVGAGGTIQHWNGITWETMASEGTENLNAIWGSSAQDIWAVGWYGEVVHWDGNTWSRVDAGTDAFLQDVWGSGPDDVWACGDGGTLLHWNHGWSAVDSGTVNALNAVWGSGPDDVWAVGERGTIVRWAP